MTEIQTRPLRDFHAKPLEMVILGKDFKYFKVEDVLSERAAYEKQIKDLKEALRRMTLKKGSVEFSNFSLKEFAQYHYDEQKKRAEAAEKQLDLFAIERQDWNKSKTNLEYHLEKAEARVKELEKELKSLEYCAIDMLAKYKCICLACKRIRSEEFKALAGEKTK